MRFGASIASLLTISSTFNSLFKVASFPHGTCALSVFRPYLALDGIYHPTLGCILKQRDSTSRQHASTLRQIDVSTTGLSPSMIPYSKGVGPWRTCVMPPPKTTIRRLSTSLPFYRDKGLKTSRILNLSCSRFTRRYSGNPR